MGSPSRQLQHVARRTDPRPLGQSDESGKRHGSVGWAERHDPATDPPPVQWHSNHRADRHSIAERLAQVTAEDVARVVKAYLRPDRRTIVIAEPEAGSGEGDDEDGA